MSSEIPLYAVMDKSRKKNRDELTGSDAAVSDVIESDEDAPKLLPRRLNDLQDAENLSAVASQSDAIDLTIGASAEIENASDLSVPPLPAKRRIHHLFHHFMNLLKTGVCRRTQSHLHQLSKMLVLTFQLRTHKSRIICLLFHFMSSLMVSVTGVR